MLQDIQLTKNTIAGEFPNIFWVIDINGEGFRIGPVEAVLAFERGLLPRTFNFTLEELDEYELFI